MKPSHFHFFFLLLFFFPSFLNLTWMSSTEFPVTLSCLKVGNPVGSVSRQGCFSFLSTDRSHLFLQCAVAWSIPAQVATYMFCMKTFSRARFLHKHSGEAIESVEGLSKGFWWKMFPVREKAHRWLCCPAERDLVVWGFCVYLLTCWWSADVRLVAIKTIHV